jgi:thiol-disulfide isomerase/thioredoxin
MRKVLAGLLLLATLTACAGDQDPGLLPGPPDVDVDTAQLRAAKERIGMADCQPGSAAPGEVEGGLPEVTLPCLAGGPDVDLTTLRGPMVINLWQAFCQPCRKEMPALQAFTEKHGDEVAVLGIDYNDVHPEAAMKLAEQTGATYPSVADPGGEFPGVEGYGRIPGLPTWIFLDADGVVTHLEATSVDTVGEVEDLVAEHLGVRL